MTVEAHQHPEIPLFWPLKGDLPALFHNLPVKAASLSHRLFIMVHMASAQLQLISSHTNWKLDRETIEVGRAGIAKARAALELAHERAEARTVTAEPTMISVSAGGGSTATQLVIELPELAAAA